MVLWLLACSASFDHPTVREGLAEFDPNTPAEDTEEDTDTGVPADDDTGEVADTGDTAAPAADEVCYPGASEDYTACLPLIPHRTSWGSDYDYPDPYNGSEQYSAPARFIDLTTADPDLMLAPNFALDEVMQEYKGDYGLYQVHVMESLQAIRDAINGALYINSGYRNVTYNAGVGGATYSRHMYGDAVDMYSSTASLSELADICDDLGAGYVSEYESHVHCDWRDSALDAAFYDVGRARAAADPPVHRAELVRSGEAWSAPATGFDEGEPRRVWAALSAEGDVLEETEGAVFSPPEGTARVVVRIGGVITIDAGVD